VIPTLLTPRVLLRAPAPADFEAYAAFYASDRAVYEDGPLDRSAAWGEFAASAAGWVLRGFGSFSLEDRGTGRYLGEAGLYQPPHYPEPEIGWILMAEAEGKGLAREAALAVRGWAYATLCLPTLVSYIDPRNVRSIRLAERLGAVLEPGAPSCGPGALVYRHPAPGALEGAA
jgi:RimJ/RimL family protein N-acetyltransferase